MNHAITKYLKGVDYNFFESVDGVYVIKEVHHAKGLRFICSYATGKSSTKKRRLFDILKFLGQPEVNRDWHFHHIVEGRDFADIDFEGQYDEMYLNQLPCVMIHKERHRAYSDLFKNSETNELYRNGGEAQKENRAKEVAAKAKVKSNHRTLLNELARREELYQNFYLGDVALQQISRNVFDEARRVLSSKV